ncbi:uncharacterized protein LOC108673527 isoform X2 [Hyalella azteca]|uniref:Uncharacterized protein LOC108673527 isoform X2 n=1 Tax=Hyalella azteca TaxID=294128 RepID=A0A8B7NSY8_HYAAZ|nr:uncharacterized protein LOC108673527 isoform X2 [Hyalella azteca]
MYLLHCVLVILLVTVAVGGDMLRKSIVFDKATPDVFYCPVEKLMTFDKMYVRARPLKKLCEFDGERLPDDYKSDCYNDVDESDFACREKKRIMMRLSPPGSELLTNEIS